MRFARVFFALIGAAAFAQQLVVPGELNEEQGKLFKKVSEAVSAPCCQNGIPVAYHDSGLAEHIRDLIKEAILAGKGEDEIMAEMGALTFGEDERKVIFTVPENDVLGWAFWLGPFALILLGFLVIFYLLNRSRGGARTLPSDDELLERYRGFIRSQLEARRPSSNP